MARTNLQQHWLKRAVGLGKQGYGKGLESIKSGFGKLRRGAKRGGVADHCCLIALCLALPTLVTLNGWQWGSGWFIAAGVGIYGYIVARGGDDGTV